MALRTDHTEGFFYAPALPMLLKHREFGFICPDFSLGLSANGFLLPRARGELLGKSLLRAARTRHLTGRYDWEIHHDGAQFWIVHRGARAVRQRRNDLLIERVADFGAVQRNAKDGTVACEEHRRHVSDAPDYMRKTPNFGAGIGALKAAASPSPSAVRVSAGSRMPSSHSRAVE